MVFKICGCAFSAIGVLRFVKMHGGRRRSFHLVERHGGNGYTVLRSVVVALSYYMYLTRPFEFPIGSPRSGDLLGALNRQLQLQLFRP